MNRENLDLTLLVPEFPEIPHVEISRDSLVSRLARSFGPSCQKQAVISDDHYGKTNLLSQFCRRYSHLAIGYFITSNPITHRYRNFLYVICNQMTRLLGGENLPPEISETELKNIYPGISVRVTEYAKTHDLKIYIVVDGIELAFESEAGLEIVSNPPILAPSSPYLLFSSTSKTFEQLSAQFKKGASLHEFEAALQFNHDDTEKYFSDLELTTEEIEDINEKSKGVAGYLAVLYDAIKLSGKDWIRDGELPDSFRLLIRDQIGRVFNEAKPIIRNALEVIAVAPKPISISCLQEYLDESIDLRELKSTGLVIFDDKRDLIYFKQNLARDTIVDRVRNRKTEIKQKLRDVVQNSSKQDNELLTLLLEELNDYNGLVALLDANAIRSSLDVGDINTLMERMRKTSKLAMEAPSAIEETSKWSWMFAATKEFLSHATTTHEVRALIAIGESQKALKMAYNFPETTSKIRLLARIYASMKDRHEHIPKSALDELEVMIDEEGIEKLDKEVVQDIAIDILPILPDKAVSLLEQVIGEAQEQGLIDIALATIKSDTADNTQEFEKTESKKRPMGGLARIHSSWLQKLDLAHLIKEIDDLENTKAKEYVIRQWCLQNRNHDELSYGIELWLNTVIRDDEFILSLRSLRQLSGLVQYLSIVDRRRLMERFHVSAIASLRTPWEEWVGFHLNLAEAMHEYAPKAAEEKADNVYEIINIEIEDYDIKVFCYARLWGAFRKMDTNKVADVKNNLERVLSHLLKHAALHDEILNKTLRILAGIDVEYALDVAFRLNTLERRKLALKTVLINGYRKWATEDLSVAFRRVIKEFGAIEQDDLVYELVEELAERDISINEESQKLLYYKSREIKNSIDKSITLVNLASIWTNETLIGISKMLEEAQASWQTEDDLKNKIGLGFQMVEHLAKIDMAFAKQFCEDVQSTLINPGAELAIGELGVMYVSSIDLAIRSLHDVEIKEQENIDKIIAQIESLPATFLRHQLFVQLAARIYTVGNYPVAEEIVQEKILDNLNDVKNQYIRNKIIAYSLPVVFWYSPEKAKKLAGELSDTETDKSWFSVVLWSITKGQLGDVRNFDTLKAVTNDATYREKACAALEQIKEDASIYLGIRVITRSLEHSVRQRKLDIVNAFDILLRIEAYANQSLPDRNNIEHPGYKIVSLARINGARSTIYRDSKRKGPFNMSSIKDKWQELEKSAKEDVENSADRIYVITILAEELYAWDSARAELLLRSISEEIKGIPSILDRSDRMNYIAKTWGMWGEIRQAEFFYSQSIELAKELDSWSQDQKLEHIVQAAYQISPDFADKLVERLDSRFPEKVLRPFRFSLTSLKYSNDLGQLLSDSKDNQSKMQGLLLKSSVNRMFTELVNENGLLPTSEEVLDLIYQSSFYEPHIANDVLKWALECENRQERHQKSALFNVFLQASVFIHQLAKWISPVARMGVSESIFEMLPGLSSNVMVFQIGQRRKAENWVKDWIMRNADEYIKICDPYFGPSELAFLSDVHRGIKILIITTTEKFAADDPEKIQQELRQAWRKFGKGNIPAIALMVVPAKLEKTFHDRAIVTRGSGLNVGPSLNGLGNEIQRITELDASEAKELEVKYIDGMLNQGKWFMDHSVRPEFIMLQ